MAEVTFRDFAAAIMKGDGAAAATALEPLLGLAPDAARAAAQHFLAQSTSGGPAFMARAMGLRSTLATGTDADIADLLGDCFGLADAPLATAVATLRNRPAS